MTLMSISYLKIMLRIVGVAFGLPAEWQCFVTSPAILQLFFLFFIFNYLVIFTLIT